MWIVTGASQTLRPRTNYEFFMARVAAPEIHKRRIWMEKWGEEV